jgi:hypothetical protein
MAAKLGLSVKESASKKQGMSAVKTSALDPASWVREFAAEARSAGFRAEPLADIDGCPLAAFTKRARGPRPRVYLSAGVHGDEPAPPHTLLDLIRSGALDDRATWFVVPMLNPTGFARGTRENADGIDLNRDYKDVRTREVRAHIRWLRHQPNFDLTLCLHEDWEATGFYLYELNPHERPSLANTILDAARAHGPIEEGETIDGRPTHAPGLIRPVDDPLMRENWPEAIYLRAHHTTLSYTLETPSSAPLARRIATLSSAVDIASSCIVREYPGTS